MGEEGVGDGVERGTRDGDRDAPTLPYCCFLLALLYVTTFVPCTMVMMERGKVMLVR
jgi:hypothetical protein